MARLYDPSSGAVILSRSDIRTYSATERADIIGFILQEPILSKPCVRQYFIRKYKVSGLLK